MDKKQRLDSVKTTTLNQTDVFDCQNSINSRYSGVRDVPLKNEVQIENLEDKADPSQVISTTTSSEAKARHNIKRALTKYAETYELERFKNNELIIICNSENSIFYDLPKYDGTIEDTKALKTTFEKFGFRATEYKELSKKEIFNRLEAFFAKDFTDCGCIGIAVLTDGNSRELWARNEQYSAMQIMEYFNVHDKPTLVTKPKFLIIQTCDSVYTGESALYALDKTISIRSQRYREYHLPVDADILMVYSSYIGRRRLIAKNPTPSTFSRCFPWCFTPDIVSNTFGWERTSFSFIQVLCNKINLLAATLDVESIIAEAKREVALDKAIKVETLYFSKGITVTMTTFIRKLYLKKFGDAPMLLPEGTTCSTSDDEADPLDQ